MGRGGTDWLWSSGKREVVAPGLREITAFGRGKKEGFEKGWRYLKTGLDERDIGAKLDYRRVNFGDSPVARGIQAITDFVFRGMGGADQPFFYGSKARTIANQATAQARNQGLRGEAARKFIDNLITNPTDEMITNAFGDATTAVFQNPTALGRLAGSIQRMGGEIGTVIVPFARTPAAVAMQILNYSPIGIMRGVGMGIAAGKDFAKIQRQVSPAYMLKPGQPSPG